MVYNLFTDNTEAFKQIYPDSILNTDLGFSFDYSDVLGNKITVSSCDDITDTICELICDFFTEYYLQDIIFNKIYDEYAIFDIKKAVEILIEFSNKLKSSALYKDVKKVLLKNNCFHFEYYMIFNKIYIIDQINAIIDKICSNSDDYGFYSCDNNVSLIGKMHNSEFSDFFDFNDDK